MNFTNIQLMAQSDITQIPAHLKPSNVLHQLKFFILKTIEAIQSFYIYKNFFEFDPHVGDTACQIRACQMLFILSSVKHEDKLNAFKKIYGIKLILKKIEEDMVFFKNKEKQKTDKKERRTITLKEFIKNNAYEFYLTETELFLTESKILTLYKCNNNENPTINFDALCNDLAVSKNSVRKLIHHYQLHISELSCNFVLDTLEKLPGFQIKHDFLDNLLQYDDDKRSVLPCFFYYENYIFIFIYYPKKLFLCY